MSFGLKLKAAVKSFGYWGRSELLPDEVARGRSLDTTARTPRAPRAMANWTASATRSWTGSTRRPARTRSTESDAGRRSGGILISRGRMSTERRRYRFHHTRGRYGTELVEFGRLTNSVRSGRPIVSCVAAVPEEFGRSRREQVQPFDAVGFDLRFQCLTAPFSIGSPVPIAR